MVPPRRNVVLSNPLRYFLKYGSRREGSAPLLYFNVVMIIEGMVAAAFEKPTKKTKNIPEYKLKLILSFVET